MRGTLSFTYVPVQMATVTSFSAADPWNGKRPSLMTLSVYQMVNERYSHLLAAQSAQAVQTASSGLALKINEVLGLRSSVDGRYHMLPIAVTRLWQKQGIRTEDLPRILAEVESGLPTSDYFSVRLNPAMKVSVWILAGLGLLMLSLAALIWTLGPPASHIEREMPAAQWLARPQREATVKLSGTLPVGDSVPIGQVEPPAGMDPIPYDASLGWYQASDGKRLILLRNEEVTDGNRNLYFRGSVIPTSKLKLPSTALPQLEARTPGLATGSRGLCRPSLLSRWLASSEACSSSADATSPGRRPSSRGASGHSPLPIFLTNEARTAITRKKTCGWRHFGFGCAPAPCPSWRKRDKRRIHRKTSLPWAHARLPGRSLHHPGRRRGRT